MPNDLYIEFKTFDSMSSAIEKLCADIGLPVLAGGSGKGWSFWSTLERCPRAFELRYIKELEGDGDPFAKDVGSAFHAFMAMYYAASFSKVPKPDQLKDLLLGVNVNPEAVIEAWRCFEAYKFRYTNDYLIPLAVEQHAEDPKTGNTCRYDLIAEVKDPPPGMFPGVYNIEHKSSAMFTWAVLEGWDMDGEVLGQAALWTKSGMDKKFGPLQGTIVNITGKQQTPKFHRAIVAVEPAKLKTHLKVLKHLDDLRVKYWIDKSFPQYFSGCITRYGKCDYYRHCMNED